MHAPSPASPAASSRQNALVIGLLVATFVLTIVCGWQQIELHRLTAATMPLPADARGVFRSARSRAFALAPADHTATRSALVRDDGSEFLHAAPSFGFKSRPAPASPLARLLDNPQFFSALQLHREAALDTRFAPLFRQLALGPDELAAFKRLLAEKENVALDVIAVSEAQPDGPLPDSLLAASIDTARARVDDAILGALGADRFAIYRDYEKSLPQRAVVAQLEQRLSYSPTPLAPAQAESLVKILAARAPAAAPRETPPTSALVVANGLLASAGVEFHASTAPITNEALTDAQSVLAPSQAAALRQLQAEQQATTQAVQILRDNLPTADSTTGGLAWQLLLQ